MAKKGIGRYIQIVLTGTVWAMVYFFIIMPILSYIFDFKFMSLTAYQEKWLDFIEFRWFVKTGFDFVLLFLMIFWLPLFVVGWWLLCKIDWRFLRPELKPKAVVKNVLKVKDKKQTYAAPRAMPSVVQVTKYVAPKLPGQQEEAKSTGQKSHTNIVQMIRAIATVGKKYQVEIFQHILLEGNRVPLAISTDARAVMIEIVNKKNVNWSVEFSEDVMKSNWYSEGGVMECLAQDLLKASASLARSEPNSEILSAIVLTDGRVLNAKQTVEYFKKHGIFLLSFNNGEPKNEIVDLVSFLSAYFELKPGEVDPAPVKLDKVPIRTPEQRKADDVSQTAQNAPEIIDEEEEDDALDIDEDNLPFDVSEGAEIEHPDIIIDVDDDELLEDTSSENDVDETVDADDVKGQ